MLFIPIPRRSVASFTAVLVMSSLMTMSAFADAPFRIESLTGEVTLERENASPVPVRAGISLGPGDVLRTGEGAAAVLVMTSGARFTLAPDTEIALDDLSLDKEEDSPSPLRLILGVVNAVVDAAAWNRDGGDGPKDVIHTPTAVIGVRGTAFDVAVSLDGATAVAVDEGDVDLDPDAGTAKAMNLGQGRAAELDPETGAVTSVAFAARDGRDWGGWRKRREDRLAAALPVWVPRLRQRFERVAAMAEQRTADIHSAMDELVEEIERIRNPPQPGKGGAPGPETRPPDGRPNHGVPCPAPGVAPDRQSPGQCGIPIPGPGKFHAAKRRSFHARRNGSHPGRSHRHPGSGEASWRGTATRQRPGPGSPLGVEGMEGATGRRAAGQVTDGAWLQSRGEEGRSWIP